MYKLFHSNHKKITRASTHAAPRVDDAQLCRRLCAATFAVTRNRRPEHTLLARSSNQTLCFSVPLTCSRPKRSQNIFHCSFHIKFHHIETRDNNRNFTCFPTCPSVSHGPVIVCVISTLKSLNVPSCRVSCCRATTYCVCLQSRLFPRGVVPCPASPCHFIKPKHGRYFQGATTLLMA